MSDNDPRTTLFLAGDVMVGRGVDQIFETSSDPVLQERYVDSARQYVELAEEAHGSIPAPVDPSYVWGEGLEVLEEVGPTASIVNLETSVTVSDDFWEGKGIHYRMHPDNVDCLVAAGVDVCSLANNHVMDFDRRGLLETIEVLEAAGIQTVGAGEDVSEARLPAKLELDGGTNLVVFGLATPSSGIPRQWGATSSQPGLNLLDDLSIQAADELVTRIRRHKTPGDIAVVSIHWGSNWGFDVPPIRSGFARRLADGGVDVLHGHSSHHVRPVETRRGNLILHGCGDLITDYEGISGHEKWRGDLGAMYFADVSPDPQVPAQLQLVPTQMKNMRLTRPSADQRTVLHQMLDRISEPFGVGFVETDDGRLVITDVDTASG